MIKLADSSELGWRLAKEHVINAIADNPDYDKRMNRAEATEEMWSKAEQIKNTTTTLLSEKTTEDKSNNFKPMEKRVARGGYMSRKLVIKDKCLNNFGTHLYRLDKDKKTYISSDMSQTICDTRMR